MTAMSPAEQSLLATIREGDASAFWALWESVSGLLFALCLREMSGNRAEAEDALERAMMKALVKLPSFAFQIVSPRAWLFRMTSNVCNDIHRERARLARATAYLAARAAPGPDADADADDGLAADPEPTSLIALLPCRLREVFILRVIQQMPYKEIAVQLELTSATARKRVQQARSALRGFREHGNPPSDRETAKDRRPMSQIARVVRVRLPSGRESDLEIVVETTQCRVRQRISTLRGYIRRHPSGWKMRLRLADLLYATGVWAEAAECYEIVLRKRPSLIAAAARLQTIRSYPMTTTV
jgi:RNA polymerase sigma factor (sigma-70 family)